MDYRGTSYQEAMDMISVDESRRAAMEDGVDETYEGMRIEIVTIDRDCYGCNDQLTSFR